MSPRLGQSSKCYAVDCGPRPRRDTSVDTQRREFVDGIPVGRHERDGSIGLDARALRGGNVPSVFSVAHWLRDRRLTFSRDAVTIAPSPADASAGQLPIEDTGESYDVIIVGSGMAGLASAFWLQRRRPGTRVL